MRRSIPRSLASASGTPWVLPLAFALLAGCAGDSDDRAATGASPPPEQIEAPTEPAAPASEQDPPETTAPPASRPARPAVFLAEGAPDPLACDSDSACTWQSVPSEDGCCDSPTVGAGTLANSQYRTWLDSYRAAECAEVQCPEGAVRELLPPCERQRICWQSRCQTACDGVPDESALPFSEISFREAKRRELVESTGRPHPPVGESQRCAARPLEGVIVLGSFRHDFGCHFSGAFVGERYFSQRPEAAAAYLEGYGWEAATTRERESMARSLVRGVLYAMESVRGVVVESEADGSVLLEFDVIPPARMRRPAPNPRHHTRRIDAGGRLR